MRIGRSRIPQLLAKRGLTQQQLAERTGLSKTQISDYVSGRRTMSLRNAKIIAEVLGCLVEDLYEWENSNQIDRE